MSEPNRQQQWLDAERDLTAAWLALIDFCGREGIDTARTLHDVTSAALRFRSHPVVQARLEHLRTLAR